MDKTESVAPARVPWVGRVHGVYPKSCLVCPFSKGCKRFRKWKKAKEAAQAKEKKEGEEQERLPEYGPLKDTTKCMRIRWIRRERERWYRGLPQYQPHFEPLMHEAVEAWFMIAYLDEAISKCGMTHDRKGELASEEAVRERRRWTALLLRLHAAMGLTCRAASELGAAVAEGMSLAEALREADELAAKHAREGMVAR